MSFEGYIYTNKESVENKHISLQERNRALARLFTQMAGGIFRGEVPVNTPIDDCLLFPQNPLNVSELPLLDIAESNIYGGFYDEALGGHQIHVSKSIFRLPRTDAEFVPDYYPYLFAESLHEELVTQGMVLPGASVFTVGDMRKEYASLTEQGYVVRYKPSWETGGRGQKILSYDGDLERVLGGMDDKGIQMLKEQGVILEANISNPESLAGAWLNLRGVKYSRVGTQTFGAVRGQMREIGTDSVVVKGDIDNLGRVLTLRESSRFSKVIQHLEILQGLMSQLPGTVITRNNFNFVRGQISRLPGFADGEELVKTYLVEHGPRLGGSSSAVAHAVAEFKSSPGLDVVRSAYRREYGTSSVIADREGGRMLYQGKSEFDDIPVRIYTYTKQT